MKIGIDAFFLNHPLNGVGQVTTHLIHALECATAPGAAPDPEFAAVFGKDCEFYLYLAQDCGRVFPANFHQRILPMKWNRGMLAKKWWEARQLPAAARRDGCDVFLSLYQSAAVMPAAVPHLMLVHDVIYLLFPEYRDNFRKRLALRIALRGLRRASHYLANSHYTKADMVKHLGLDPAAITVAHLAADPRFTIPLTSAETETVLRKYRLTPGYLYHGGGLNGRKNARGVLEAYRLLLDQSQSGIFPGAVPPLVISGKVPSHPSPESPVAQWAEELAIADHLVLTGQIPPEDLPALYRGASVFLYPSRYEGFGLPVLEAMHQGVPVVTANTSSLPEVGGDAALYCDPERPAEIADAVRRILTDATTRQSLSQRGLERAAGFTWDAFVRELTRATAHAMSEARRRSGTRS